MWLFVYCCVVGVCIAGIGMVGGFVLGSVFVGRSWGSGWRLVGGFGGGIFWFVYLY